MLNISKVVHFTELNKKILEEAPSDSWSITVDKLVKSEARSSKLALENMRLISELSAIKGILRREHVQSVTIFLEIYKRCRELALTPMDSQSFKARLAEIDQVIAVSEEGLDTAIESKPLNSLRKVDVLCRKLQEKINKE